MMMRLSILALTIFAGGAVALAVEATSATASPPAPAMVLWQEGAPGAMGSRDVDIPTLTAWLAPEDIGTGAAMVICPGGGYGALAPHEGADYARWFNEMGISAFVLKYRLGSSGYRHPAMLNDAAQAMRIVRANANEWKIDPARVGIIGSSAGGHLASTLLTHFDSGDPQSTDTIERQTSNPDLGVLCYPVITATGKAAHTGSIRNLLGDAPPVDLIQLLSNESQVTSATPPVFLFHTADDSVVKVENSLMFSTALAEADVPFELHVYPSGRHGMGLGSGKEWDPSRRHPWTSACEAWLKKQGFAR